jgi:Mg-chelatase subunit ChlI
MPKKPEEVLADLNQAVEEAKTTIRDAHALRKEILHSDKALQKAVADEVRMHVYEAVTAIALEIRNDMRRQAEGVIKRLEEDWRDKLGLNDE